MLNCKWINNYLQLSRISAKCFLFQIKTKKYFFFLNLSTWTVSLTRFLNNKQMVSDLWNTQSMEKQRSTTLLKIRRYNDGVNNHRLKLNTFGDVINKRVLCTSTELESLRHIPACEVNKIVIWTSHNNNSSHPETHFTYTNLRALSRLDYVAYIKIKKSAHRWDTPTDATNHFKPVLLPCTDH